MNSLEQRVLDAIDVEAMLAFLCRLIATPSLGGEESAAQRLMAEQMERCGLDVDVWEIDLEDLRRHPAHSEEIPRTEALGVVGTLPGDSSRPSLILNGHVDVVPAGRSEHWTYPPWQGTLTDRRVYGRGAADMKGGLCAALFALKALRDAGVAGLGTLTIQSVVGEEDGGTGTLATLQRGYSADGAIVVEPTGLAVVPVQAGALNFRITITGKAVHASMRRSGVSAIEKFMPLFSALQGLERTRNRHVSHPLLAAYSLPYPISVGTLRAGDWPSSVPAELVFEGRLGVAVGEPVAAARQSLEQTLTAAAAEDAWLRDHPPEVDWWGGQFAPCATDIDDPVVTIVQTALRTLTGYDAPIQGVTYGSDLRLLTGEGGIPAVLFGPGDVRQAHQVDEFVPIDDLILAVRCLALTALRYCNREPASEEGGTG